MDCLEICRDVPDVSENGIYLINGCETCHTHSASIDYLLHAQENEKPSIKICDDCGEIVYMKDLTPSHPNRGEHLANLQKYISGYRSANQGTCEVCYDAPGKYRYGMHGGFAEYPEANVCNDCGKTLYKVELKPFYPSRKLHLLHLRAYVEFQSSPHHGACELCHQEEAKNRMFLPVKEGNWPILDVGEKCGERLEGFSALDYAGFDRLSCIIDMRKVAQASMPLDNNYSIPGKSIIYLPSCGEELE